jgi:hypothetical protein
MRTAKYIALICLVMILSIYGCNNPFRPKIIDSSSSTVLNRTPVELLENLEKSYSEKNIKLFRQLLHKDFRFELLQSEYSLIGIDMDGDNIPDSWWGYDEEVEMTRNMFERGSSDGMYPAADRIDLRLQIPPQEMWELDPTPGRETWKVILCRFTLTLSYNKPESYYVANGMARFYVMPEDGKWKIIIWRDESLI